MKAVLTLVALLAACNPAPERPAGNQTAESAPTPAMPAASPAPAKAFELDDKTDLLEFHYGWSTEAAAVPELVARFQTALAKAKSEIIAGAKKDKSFRDKEGYPFHAYSSSTDYSTAGQSPRLLSLVAAIESYTGGAHGNKGSKGLLWDRQERREIGLTDLFAKPSSREALLTDRWCSALNKARETKREEPVGKDGPFDECPKLDEIAIVPADRDANGRFERLLLIADPYVAGPWSEGDYEIELPLTRGFLAALKPDYRASFEVQPQ